NIAFSRFSLLPDNFSFLFLILFLMPFILNKKRLLFILPVIEVFWVNMHGFFFLGPIVLLLYLLLAKIKNKEIDKSFYNTVKIIFLLTLLACFLNPQPLETIKYPIKVVKDIAAGNQKAFFKYIQELQSPFAEFSANRLFFGVLVFAFICLGFVRKLNFFYVGLAIVFAAFSLNSLRNMYFFVPVAIVIFIDRFNCIKDFLLKGIFKEGGFYLLKACFIFWIVLFSVDMTRQIIYFSHRSVFMVKENKNPQLGNYFFGINPYQQPKDMLEFIKTHKLPGRMFNTFNIGAHMIFNFFPERKVFIDGRAEFYGRSFFSNYIKLSEGSESALKSAIEEYKLEGFIICYYADTPASAIKNINNKGFKCVYFGWDGIIFVSDKFIEENPSLKSLIVDFNSVKVDKFDLANDIKLKMPYIKSYLNKANVLYLLGYDEKSKAFLEEIIKLYPNNYETYLLLAKIYYREKDYDKAFLYCRDSLFFNSSSSGAHALLARIYIKKGLLDDARKEAEKYKVNFKEFLEEVKNEKL
ncbi:MAG: CDC27 family protein, partial [Candidatus Omnitrophica bacterium]|nr:CDC27 family protein [Candidatus Omnitrophota bacterium]